MDICEKILLLDRNTNSSKLKKKIHIYIVIDRFKPLPKNSWF